MDEIAKVLKVANAAFRTVKAMNFAKKAVVAGAAVACCCFAFRFWRNI